MDNIYREKREDPLVKEFLINSDKNDKPRFALEDISAYISNEKPSTGNDMSKVKMIVEQARKNNLTKFI